MTAASAPQPGIFWMVAPDSGAKLLAASCSLDQAEHYGDCLTFGPGHYEIWRGWRRSRELDADLRAIVRAYEYEDWPRGRIVLNRAQDRFILYCDRKLMRPTTIQEIQEHFQLAASRTVVEGDFHYQSKETPVFRD